MKSYLLALGVVGLGAAGMAAVSPPAAPDPFRKLLDCKAITAPDQRLACYDAQADVLDAAQKKKEIVVVSKAQVREVRKSLFGFSLPNLSLFTGGRPGKEDREEKAEEITRLETKLVSASQTRNGNWYLTLAEGGSWETMSELGLDPRPGDKVVINRAMLGSFLGSVGGNHGVRMRRVG